MLHNIRLELARCSDFPEGSAAHGYELVAPLAKDGRLDAHEWKTVHDQCTVRRFWDGEPEQRGMLIHRRNDWAFSYVPDQDSDDEPIFKLDRHVMKLGEYVSITEHDGAQRTFRVAAVE